jgi:integrase
LQKKPTDARQEIRDHGALGLYLVIQPKPTGAKSWALRFQNASGKSAKLVLGSLDFTDDAKLSEKMPAPQPGEPLTLGRARQLAAKLQAERMSGIDIVAKYAKSRQKDSAANLEASSFRALAIEFFRTYKTKRSHERPRRWRKDARLLGLVWNRDDDPAQVQPTVLPGSLCDVWGNRAVTVISRREIEDVVEDAKAKNIPGLIAKNPGVSENRGRKLFAILSVFFGWLAKRRYVDVDVTVSVEAPHAPKARSRILTGAELRWCWLAADQLPYPHGPVVKMLLLCGQRLNEVGGMCRSELNADASLWSIPPQRTKNWREHSLPLPMLARGIIGAIPIIENRDLVFTVGGRSAPSNWSHAKHDLDSAMAAIAKKERGKAVTIPHFTLHDLRRSCGSGLQHIGTTAETIERVLNHTSGVFADVAGTYQRDPLTDDMRTALSSWARYLQMVSNKSLHGAHEALLLRGDDDERSRNLQYFRACIIAGGDRWQAYLKALTGEKPAKLADLTSERHRRSKR